MDLQVIDQLPARAMTVEEEDLARVFYDAVQSATNNSARSIQASGHRVGVSDLGHCSERVRRSLLGEIEPRSTTRQRSSAPPWVITSRPLSK